jgi:hypothetical protein
LGIILAEFEFCSKFRWNCFINLAGAWVEIDSSRIPGIAWIPPDSSSNQWGTVKTSAKQQNPTGKGENAVHVSA